MSKSDNLSEDEMVSYLKRTLSPTILVEGNDELSIYNRYLQDKINVEDIDILTCDGRAKLALLGLRGKLYICDTVFAGVARL